MVPTFHNKLFIIFGGDLILLILATWYAPWIRGWQYEVFDLETGASVLTIMFYLLMIYVFDLYNVQRVSFLSNTALRISIAVGAAGVLSTILFYSIPQFRFGRSVFLVQVVLVWCSLVIWRYFFQYIFAKGEKEKVVIIGRGESGKELYSLLSNPLSPYQVVGVLDDDPAGETDDPKVKFLGTTERLIQVVFLEGIKSAIVPISHVHSAQLVRNLVQARLKMDINIIEMPKLYETLTRSIPVEHIDDRWILSADGFNLISRRHVWRLKQLSDFCLAVLLLILTAPLIGLLSLIIPLDSPGPAFFKQKRVGYKGRIFTLLKFRSMIQDAEQDGAVWADKSDPRVTRVGRFIRKLRLDETPQVINILRGEMSLIGPRPERPEFVEELENRIPYYAFRHLVRPGITGWAQVNFPYGASVEDGVRKLEYDLFYIKNMNFLLDLKITLKTIGVVIFGEGAR
ncbi:MAG: sugar transferase [Desulfobacteraceae bacterium]|nr:MAG: sugar transferase [Desulfobacteraceae bacterium]